MSHAIANFTGESLRKHHMRESARRKASGLLSDVASGRKAFSGLPEIYPPPEIVGMFRFGFWRLSCQQSPLVFLGAALFHLPVLQDGAVTIHLSQRAQAWNYFRIISSL